MRAHRILILFLFVLLACTPASTLTGPATDVEYYAIEINDVLCGYATLASEPVTVDGQTLTRVDHDIFAMVSVLGSAFNTRIENRFLIDPDTGRYIEAESIIDQGTSHVTIRVEVDGNLVRHETSLRAAPRTVELGPDVILENPLASPHLVRDFIEGDLDEATYETFQLIEGEIQPVRYTRAGRERLELLGETHETILLDAENLITAVRMRLWLDAESGDAHRIVLPNGRTIYRADPSVAKKVEAVNLDSTIISKVNVSIPDFRRIASMKVRAVLEPTGYRVAPADLNVPGQKFTGTVEDNRIEGIFEIAVPRYDGTDAPSFPPSFGEDETLGPYLEPGDLIESDDEVLVALAREITAGSSDAWQATQRIAEWVAHEIDYAIPGGGTARRTYDLRAGECGSHSNLTAALARAVGIPTRVVWGVMYVPNLGGAFGQHAWNEVYMGRAGWVPLDATAFETAHLDSGHIRIGVHESLATAVNPIEFEILDHALAGGTPADERADFADRYAPFVGTYRNVDSQRQAKIQVGDSGLLVELPDQVKLPLNDAGPDGHWDCALTPRIYVTFEGDPARPSVMCIHELARMRKQRAPETIDENVPQEWRPYLGDYLFAAVNAEFTVIYEDGRLAVKDPLAKKTIGLQPPGEDGGFLDEFGKNTIFFELDDEGNVTRLTVDAVARFERI